MPTIKDVAERAHVSIATVSRVVNKTRYVSPDVVRRVQQAIHDLDYQHNALARNLRRSQSLTIGVIIPDSNNPFFAEMTRGIEDTCFEEGYVVVLCNSNEDMSKAASYLTTLYQHRTAGLIVVAPGDMTEPLEDYIQRGYPIVLVDRPLPHLPADMVVSDNYGGAKLAIQYLVSLGHRRIGLITGDHHLETVKSRWCGVEEAMKEAGLPLLPELTYNRGDFLAESGREAAAYFFRLGQPPTAIFALNDLMALGVLSYAYDHHIHIPTQLSVVGFDNIEMTSYAVPGLTTVAQPKYELGQQAATLLLKRIQGDTAPLQKTTLPTRLILRHSTGRPRADT
jgi:LacI family transcriptional regulator